jgi:protein SCO1/2
MPLAFGIVFLAALLLGQPRTEADTAPVIIGGPFALTAPDGATVTDQTYRGKWLLVFFGYTFCPDVCPTTLNEIAEALQKLGPDAAKLQAIFITVDPERDTPDVMGKYVQAFDSRIVGLTGDRRRIAAAAKEYGAYGVAHAHAAGASDYLVDHSTYIYLMDPEGRFAHGFDAQTPGDQIADAIRKIMMQ